MSQLPERFNRAEEVWRPIAGHDHRYEVSNLGNVRSTDILIVTKIHTRTTKSRILKPAKSNSGYLRVSFNNGQGGKLIKFSVHRLVATAFVANPDNLPCVNHKDGNRLNNCAANLEWITVSGNTQHAYDTGLLKPSYNRKGKTGDLNKTNLHVQQWTLDGQLVEEFQSISLTKQKGFIPSCVGRCAKGDLKKHKGFIWKYPSEPYKALFSKEPAL